MDGVKIIVDNRERNLELLEGLSQFWSGGELRPAARRGLRPLRPDVRREEDRARLRGLGDELTALRPDGSSQHRIPEAHTSAGGRRGGLHARAQRDPWHDSQHLFRPQRAGRQVHLRERDRRLYSRSSRRGSSTRSRASRGYWGPRGRSPTRSGRSLYWVPSLEWGRSWPGRS